MCLQRADFCTQLSYNLHCPSEFIQLNFYFISRLILSSRISGLTEEWASYLILMH